MKNESFNLGYMGLAQMHGERFAQGDLLTALLNRATTAGGDRLVARLVATEQVSCMAHWVRCDNGAYLKIAMIAAQALAFHENRIADVADALDAAEPLLAAVEASSGILLEPVELCNLPNETLVGVLVSRADVSDQIYIAIPSQSKLWNELENVGQAIGIDYSEISVPFNLDLQAARLKVEEVAGLAVGDVLLLGSSIVAACLTWASNSENVDRVEGRYDVRCGRFTADSHPLSASGFSDQREESAAPASPTSDFAVPITVRLAGWNASAGELASVRDSGRLDLGVAESHMIASLMVGETPLAAGALVRIADQTAVRIDRRIEASEDATAAESGATV